MFGHQTYLVFEVCWALPVLLLHWIVGWRRLAPRLGLMLIAAVSATAYLSVADGVAIHTGIWTLHADRVLGPALDRVPMEESLFFLLTNLMVAQTIVLLWRPPRRVS
ncbi:MAG TPA: lycopene cyclase domain-containing protein [Chloroflexota bacterium]|nr:lycopene cyclase domain-containing protein [Chloroflexota bacterium]